MKSKSIIFSGKMVKAILEGRKTMTRRVIKPQPIYHPKKKYWSMDQIIKNQSVAWEDGLRPDLIKFCPYGQPGDQLWVRESYSLHDKGILYRADAMEDDSDERIGWWIGNIFYANQITWKPSIFMNRKYSRITLEIINVRVERIQEISEEDAIKEGCIPSVHPGTGKFNNDVAVVHFSCLWDELNEKRGYGWEKNPWVWVIEFKWIK